MPGQAARSRTADEAQAKFPELEAQPGPRIRTAESQPGEKPRSGGCLCGCVKWVVGLVAAGVVVLVVLFSLDVVSPRDKPCPLESPPIPTPAQIASLGDLFRDQCVRVRGTVVFQGDGELVLEMNRAEIVQRVTVRDPSQVLDAVPLGRVLTLAGWLRVEEDGAYAVHFIPERESDRGWWRNLRENVDALF